MPLQEVARGKKNDQKSVLHREKEKARHHQVQKTIKEVGQMVGVSQKETQRNILNRAARYCLYLSEVEKCLEKQILSGEYETGFSEICSLHGAYNAVKEAVDKTLDN